MLILKLNIFLYSIFTLVSNAYSEKAYVFSTSSLNWKYFNWSKISTIVQFNFYDEDLINFAHDANVTVHTLANFDKSILSNYSKIDEWVQVQITSIINLHFDGINVDFEDEISCDDVQSINGYNYLMKELYLTLKNINSKYQLTVDFAWSPDNIDNRCYDYVTLSKYADYVFVMSYDERSEIFYECIAWANSAINNTFDGILQYLKIGVPNYKIILGLPWYGYDYPCIKYYPQTDVCILQEVSFRRANCSDAAGSQKGFSNIMINYLPNATGPIVIDQIAKSPYFTYKLNNEYHQIWFDDTVSLKMKYSMAPILNLHSVGFWEADSLDYSQNPENIMYYQQMWNALP